MAYQAVKYRQRNGWTHADVMRLAHPKADDEALNAVFRWITQNEYVNTLPSVITGYLAAQEARDAKTLVKLIGEYRLTHEMLPNDFKKDPAVWRALLPHMPMTAMLRNLGRMTANNALTGMGSSVNHVMQAFSSERVRKARIHPLSILVGMKTYSNGHGLRGSLTWSPIGKVLDALNEAFYISFENVEPTEQNILVAVDTSGSMTYSTIAGMPLTPREASAALAMSIIRSEPNWEVIQFSETAKRVPITPRQNLIQVMRTIASLPAYDTNIGGVIEWADRASQVNEEPFNTIIIITDNEVNRGRHVDALLNRYRQKYGKTKLVVIGMVMNEFTVGDPNDMDILNIGGFDSAAPGLIHDFIAGRF